MAKTTKIKRATFYAPPCATLTRINTLYCVRSAKKLTAMVFRVWQSWPPLQVCTVCCRENPTNTYRTSTHRHVLLFNHELTSSNTMTVIDNNEFMVLYHQLSLPSLGVGKWAVTHVLTCNPCIPWITRVATIKRQTRTGHGCYPQAWAVSAGLACSL